MSLIFRPMTESDFPACAAELMAAFKEEPWNEVWTYEQAYDRIDEIMSARVSRGYVCMDGDKCVSMLCGRIMTYQDKKMFYVDEFSVRPDCQRRGVGSQMLSFLRGELQKEPQPINHMALVTTRGFPSVAFYEHNGFVELPDEITMAGYVLWP
ncbi:MAG: GNAT family N-acetyltransferase [Clostridia bacterium]|nr:GNAT family N-acetyltransferase [Clostridia bacterium]